MFMSMKCVLEHLCLVVLEGCKYTDMFAVLARDLGVFMWQMFAMMCSSLWQSPRLDRMAYWEGKCHFVYHAVTWARSIGYKG